MRVLIWMGALLIGSAAWSQETENEPYVGVGFGKCDYDFTEADLSFSDSTTIRKLYGGYRFTERWAIEGFTSSTSTLEQDDFTGFPVALEYDFIGLRGTAYFGAFFVGMAYWDAEVDNQSPIITTTLYTDDSDVSLVLGGEWSFRDAWDIRLDYEEFDVDGSSEADAFSLSLGVHYKFSRR